MIKTCKKCGHRKGLHKDYILGGEMFTSCHGIYGDGSVLDLKCDCVDFRETEERLQHRQTNKVQDGVLTSLSKSEELSVGSVPCDSGSKTDSTEVNSVRSEDSPSKSLIEELAELEHQQWLEWSQNLWVELKSVYRDLDEAIDINSAIRRLADRKERWQKNWIPYFELSEKVKEQDRVYARKVIVLLKGLLNSPEFEEQAYPWHIRKSKILKKLDEVTGSIPSTAKAVGILEPII